MNGFKNPKRLSLIPVSDTFTKAQRSEIMRSVHSTGTETPRSEDKLNTPEKIKNQKTRSRSSKSELEGLIEAARAVVRAHFLRDHDKASDEDVSDAIAVLEGCLPRHREGRAAKQPPIRTLA